ncbi:MAG: serine hydrolase domain-containing protein [Chloroflexota bacterium]
MSRVDMGARYCVTMFHASGDPRHAIRAVLEAGLAGRPHPACPGAVALVLRDGETVAEDAVGHALRYADASGSELPAAEQVPMSSDTLFDLASLTKLFTTVVLLSLVDDGALTLDSPIHAWLPSFSVGVRRSVSVRHLLSHTSGLPAWLQLWDGHPDADARRAAVLGAPLERGAGAAFAYSDLGFMVAGWLAEAVTGTPLARLVEQRVCRPLGMADAGFLPSPGLVPRIAATEDESYAGRGMLRGAVHDENAWCLGGAVGHAGVFATARDVARLGEMIRLGGALDGVRVLGEGTAAEMCADQLPAHLDPGFRQGLGVRIGDPGFMGRLSGPLTVGHTGFTGTSLVVDCARGLTVVLLTNRVHPSRTWSDVGHLRRALADAAMGLDRPARTRHGPRSVEPGPTAPPEPGPTAPPGPGPTAPPGPGPTAPSGPGPTPSASDAMEAPAEGPGCSCASGRSCRRCGLPSSVWRSRSSRTRPAPPACHRHPRRAVRDLPRDRAPVLPCGGLHLVPHPPSGTGPRDRSRAQRPSDALAHR